MCSSSTTSSRAGHSRRTLAPRTHGNRSKAARAAPRFTVKNPPRTSLRTTSSTCSRVTCWSSPAMRTSRNANCGSRAAYTAAVATTSSAASANSASAAVFRSAGLSHMRRLQDPYHQLLERYAASTGSHRHQAMARHARKRVDFEQPWLLLRVEHDVDAPPAAAPDRAERSQRQRLQFLLFFCRQPAGAMVFRVVGKVLVLVVVVALGRLDADQRQHLVTQHRRGVFRSIDKFLRERGVAKLLCRQLIRRRQLLERRDFG